MKKIGILIPSTSRGRSWKSYKESYLYNNTLKTFFLTYNQEHSYIFYIGIDTDDNIYDNKQNQNEYEKFVKLLGKDVTIKFIQMTDIKSGHLTMMWNRLFREAYGENCDYFFQCGDDIEFRTKGWVNDSINVLQQSNNIGMTGPINNNYRILTQSFVSREHMKLFGYYYPPEIINWCCDDWINGVYRKINRFYPLRKHVCINIGGAPRYVINGDKNFTVDIRKKTLTLRRECEKIVNKDVERITALT
jgi:hypothetical protein